MPTAVKDCEAPTFKLMGVAAGSIIMADNTLTVIATGWLVSPPKVAVIFAVPPPTAVVVPPAAIVTAAVLELDQTT